MLPPSHKFYRTTSEAWQAMYQAIGQAEFSIFWEVYIFFDDAIGRRFIDLLTAKARGGVTVKLIIDAFGSWRLSRLAEAELKGAGVEVLKYNAVRWRWPMKNFWEGVWRRNHRKLLIIDESRAFLGGVNIEFQASDWDDISVELTGPVVRTLLKSFVRSYRAAEGAFWPARRWRRRFKAADPAAVTPGICFIADRPRYRRSAVRRIFVESLRTARERLNILTPYFVPDPGLLRLLAAARWRGVKINLFLPLRPDHRLMEWIARAYYGVAHRLGATLYFLPRMNHGKALTADGALGFIGSPNVTPRSFRINEEGGVVFRDPTMVAELNALFARWQSESLMFDEPAWRQRSLKSRIAEWWARRFERWV